jgi:uncharacterized cupin superfamily protein
MLRPEALAKRWPGIIAPMRRFNLHRADFIYEDSDPEGYEAGYARVSQEIGASELNARHYELPEGQSICPYHYEYVEEWLIVLDGRPTLRHPGGEEELTPGDVVAFPAGPEGAHKVTNRGAETARVLMFSSARMPAVAVYPDSDKVGVFTEGRRDDVMVRRASRLGRGNG